jgi:hypothetical protein
MQPAEHRRPDEAAGGDFADDARQFQALRDFGTDLRGHEDDEQAEENLAAVVHAGASGVRIAVDAGPCAVRNGHCLFFVLPGCYTLAASKGRSRGRIQARRT